MLEGLHISRGWTGGDKEFFPECTCLEADCGYVISSDSCPQHSFWAAKTIRSGHRIENCPEKEDKNVAHTTSA